MSRVPFDNRRFPHTCVITRYTSDDPMSDEGTGEEIYNGECRCYSSHDTTVNKEYDINYRELSVPWNIDEWSDDTFPREYDKVEVDYGFYKENLYIVQRKVGTMGTHFQCRLDNGEQ